MKFTSEHDVAGGMRVTAHFDPTVNMVSELVLVEVAKGIAARYVQDNYDEICKHMSPEAIANLSIAQASNNIANEYRQGVNFEKEQARKAAEMRAEHEALKLGL